MPRQSPATANRQSPIANRQSLRRLALRRITLADRQVPRLRANLAAWYDIIIREAAREAQAAAYLGLRDWSPAYDTWPRKLASVLRPVVVGIVGQAWILAGDETARARSARRPPRAVPRTPSGSRPASLRGKALDSPRRPPRSAGPPAGGASPPAGVSIPDWDRFVQSADWKTIDRWVATTAESSSATTAARISTLYRDASRYWDPEKKRGLTPREIAAQLLDRGLVVSEQRADMLARTGAIWGHNEGAVERYAADGIAVVEWLVTVDDLTCPFCAEMNGKRVGTGDPFFESGDALTIDGVGTLRIPSGPRGFDVRHPPLHPHCRCCLVPVVV